MKHIALLLVGSLMIFFTGYFTYPVLHGDFLFSDKPFSAQPSAPLVSTKPTAVPNHEEPITQQVTEAQPIQNNRINEATKVNTVKQNTAPINNTEEVPSEDELALIAWATQHKSDINDIVDAYFPASLRELMKKNINDNNHFLNNPSIEQPPEDDDNWAFVMEQKLRYLINGHDLSDNIELLNVACKQLVCELVVIDQGGRSWRRIFFSMYDVLPIRQRREHRPKYASLFDEGDRYIYSQIFFEHGLTAF